MKRIIHSIPAFTLLVILLSCKSPNSGSSTVNSESVNEGTVAALLPCLNLPDAIDRTKDAYLSEFVSSISYIPLETTMKFLIGEGNVHVKPAGEYIFVSEHGKPVGEFDRTGKFIRKIGAIGKGPGEYNFDFIFWPDSTSRQVYVLNSDKGSIMTYSFEGAFIREIIPETRPGTFVSMGNGQFMTWTFMQKESNGEFYRIFFHDGAGKTIRYVSEPKKKYDFSRGISIMTPLLTPAPGGYLYNSWENDTIFRAATDGSFVPAFSWLPGRLRMPIDGSRDYARFLREKDNYILDLNAFESLSKWLVRYDYHGRENLALYDKRSRDFFVVANPDTAGHGIWNDIDGGPSFFPSWDNENGHHFIKLLNAIDLVGSRKDISVSAIQPRDPASAKKFREMADSLTANSNPVVMMVEIK